MTFHPSRVIFDIDGTLADISHRLHHIQGEKKNWPAFHEGLDDDQPKMPIIMLARMIHGLGHEVILTTGRFEAYRERTDAWLRKHTIFYEQMFMRPDGDHTPDDELKEKMLHEHIGTQDLLFAVDDRTLVVEMWRRNGVTCLQCQKGDY